jgi:small subunit ribosomal protein S17
MEETMEDRNSRLTRTGVVVSAGKMDKTIVVNVVSRVNHKVYKKVVQKSKKFKVHDENNECGVGDTVLIMETRPMSKDKYYRLVKIIEKAK